MRIACTWVKCALNALLIVLSLAIGVQGQTLTGRISGTVTDVSGAVLPGVKVTVTNDETKLERTVETDANGFYVATNLPVGNYSVTVERQGFKKAGKTGYSLVTDGRLTIDFALEAGAVTETVEVTASAGETVNSTSGEVARTIDGSQVQELALNGRNYFQLTTLIPGAPHELGSGAAAVRAGTRTSGEGSRAPHSATARRHDEQGFADRSAQGRQGPCAPPREAAARS